MLKLRPGGWSHVLMTEGNRLLHMQFGVWWNPDGSVFSLHFSEEVLLASCSVVG